MMVTTQLRPSCRNKSVPYITVLSAICALSSAPPESKKSLVTLSASDKTMSNFVNIQVDFPAVIKN